MAEVRLELPSELVEAIALRAAELAAAKLREERSPWLTRREAAAYLRLPVSRLEKDRRLPCHKDGGRVLYHRGELDAYFERLGRG
jgi:excisionase family DNA binding protein